MKRNRVGIVVGVCVLVLLCAALLPAVWAQEQKAAGAAAKENEWKPEDVVMYESAAGFQVSPDGKWAVWVKSTADKEKDGRVTNLMLSSLTTKKEIQLTRGTETHAQPKWSPNGELIAFLSTRALPKPNPDLARMQLWLINPFGGEPYHLTEFARGLRGYEWVDNDTIVFSAEEDPTLYENDIKKKKDDTRVVDDVLHTPPVRLFRLNVTDKKVTRLTENDDWIDGWSVSPDGKWAATIHEQYLSYQWDNRIPPKTFLYNLTTGERKQVSTDERFRPMLVRWAKDASGFYAIAPYTTHPKFYMASILLLYFYDTAAGALKKVELDWENGLGFGFETTKDGFVAILPRGVYRQPAKYVRSGDAWQRTNIDGEHAKNLSAFAVSEDARTIVYEYSTASKPEQWYRAQLDGSRLANPVQITEINPQLKNKTFAKAEIVRWKGAKDEEVEGVLYYPHNYQPGKKYALFTAPHGGPAGADMDAWTDSWAYPHNLLNQRGAFILKPNYHGSSDYGLKWVESICCGKYYEYPVEDIEKGVDLLIAKGLVDPERIGTFGWSNGSILSIAVAIHNPDRYKVMGAGAGDVEWISDWANVDFGQAFDAYYFGKSPLEDPMLYVQMSPVFQMDRLKAPTIIFFGSEDRNVPTGQGWTHYRALYNLDKVPVKFLLFPGEPHALRKLTHQLRKVEEEMVWFDRYLFKTEQPANEAFSDASPLGIAFRRKNVAKVGAVYGIQLQPKEHSAKIAGLKVTVQGSSPNALIPEVVKRGELEIGRFEVTRAQYAAFDSAFKFAAGTENFPAIGITLEKAKAYAAWLAKLTGQTWRVPNEEEMKSLYEVRTGENTLDYWAGYAINPDDAERLKAKIKELGAGAPLLKEVGSFTGNGKEGEELIFDLGGNAAEWALGKDGSGKALGGSADRAADSKAQFRPAGADYTGFRVVRGEPKKEEVRSVVARGMTATALLGADVTGR